MPSNKIQKLIKMSREVIKDCALENGAIVAANTDKPYVPREASNYRWVWPRDAAFTCVAADILNIPIQKPFFRWLDEVPQDFKRDQLLYANYATNGRKGSMGGIFEPDQMGQVLWSIYHHFQKDLKQALKFRQLIERLANGITSVWDGTHFSVHTVDLWEEVHRHTSTTGENNFTFSLASCARGLLLADKIIPTHLWKEKAMEILKEIDAAYNKKDKYFYRNVGKIADKNIDASLLGLAWPFEIYDAGDERIINTVEKIETHLASDGGVHRYQFDYYDGEGSAQEGGGAWPILNFWLSIYWVLKGNKKKALDYYNWVLTRLDKYQGYIPEQIFDDFRTGVYPLAWSHAMFIIASKFLGYL